MNPGHYLLVALGAFVGANCRYLLSKRLARISSGFPWATMLINVTGSFLLGLLLTINQPALPASYRLLLGTGFLGAYTTFSTFSYETVTLAQRGEYVRAASNLLANIGLGLFAAALGIVVAGGSLQF